MANPLIHRFGTPLPEPPQVVSPFELRAINDPATGKERMSEELCAACTK
jgi:hypothetical protein